MRFIFIAPWYSDYYPVLPASLLNQSHQDWKLLMIHDGPVHKEENIPTIKDARVQILYTQSRANDYGHSLRALVVNEFLDSLIPPEPGDVIIHTNADNYYLPHFCERMAPPSWKKATYCDMLHSHWRWAHKVADLNIAKIDCGCVVAERELAVKAGWPTRRWEADWDWIQAMIDIESRDAFMHIEETLFIHN